MMLKKIILNITVFLFLVLIACSSDYKNGSTQKINEQSVIKEAKIEDILEEITRDNMESYIKMLASFNRSSLGDSILLAQNAIKKTLEGFGYAVSLQSFPFQFRKKSYSGKNIIIEKNGVNTSLPPIIVCAHYDSRSDEINNPAKAAPGANDNGSGSAILIEFARLLSKRSVTQTVRLIWFDAEEENLLGSKYYANKIKSENEKIQFVFNIDMVGGFTGMRHKKLVCEEDQNGINAEDAISKNLNKELIRAVQTYTTLETVIDKICCTDYIDFERNDYPVVGIYEYRGQEDNPNYHQSSDTFENMNFPYYMEVTKGSIAFLLKKARVLE